MGKGNEADVFSFGSGLDLWSCVSADAPRECRAGPGGRRDFYMFIQSLKLVSCNKPAYSYYSVFHFAFPKLFFNIIYS